MSRLEMIKLRRGTAAEWADVNPVLAEGEPGFETDTRLLKIGDGETAWADLDYTDAPNVAAEVAARIAGDDDLQAAITAETTAREAGDTDEASARTDADDALGGRIDTEIADREAADDALGGRVDTEITDRENADALLVPLTAIGVTVAELVGGLLPTSRLPALALTDTYVVASEAEMLDLAVQKGDVAVRSDVPGAFILATDDPTDVDNWVQLPTPADAVLSVNGQNGVIVLSAADVGADPAGAAAAAQAASQPHAADLDSLASGGAPATAWLRALLDAVYVAAGAAASVQDPLGIGYPTNQLQFSTLAANINANLIGYQRLFAGGYQISKLRMYVGVSSGSLNAGIYGHTGAGITWTIGNRIAQTGSIPVPSSGAADLSLGAAVTPARDDLFAFVVDNLTATFFRASISGASQPGAPAALWQRSFQEATAANVLPLTPTPASTTAGSTPGMAHLIGVA